MPHDTENQESQPQAHELSQPQSDESAPQLNDESLPQNNELPPQNDQSTPQVDKSSPQNDESPPQLNDDSLPQVDESSPQNDESQPKSDELPQQTDELLPQVDESLPQNDESPSEHNDPVIEAESPENVISSSETEGKEEASNVGAVMETIEETPPDEAVEKVDEDTSIPITVCRATDCWLSDPVNFRCKEEIISNMHLNLFVIKYSTGS